jgi:hypothetical protein
MRLNLIYAMGLVLVSLVPVAAGDDAAEIKKLIPAAAGMARADFEKVALSDRGIRPSDVVDKTLSWLLLCSKPREDAKAKEQFRLLTPSYPKPSELGAEMYRVLTLGGSKVVLAPVTMIHANRITKLTCDVKGDTARGVVSFEVPKLYAGQADYAARKVDGAWHIVEFAMHAYAIHIVLGEDGKWKEKPAN